MSIPREAFDALFGATSKMSITFDIGNPHDDDVELADAVVVHVREHDRHDRVVGEKHYHLDGDTAMAVLVTLIPPILVATGRAELAADIVPALDGETIGEQAEAFLREADAARDASDGPGVPGVGEDGIWRE